MNEQPMSETEHAAAAAEGLDPNYRTWNIPALLACLCAALSLLSLLTPALVFLPVAVLLLGWQGLRTARRAPEYSLGLTTAKWAMLLASFCLGLIPARHWFERDYLLSGARQTTDQWFAFLRENKPGAAYELFRRTSLRFFNEAAFEEFLLHNENESDRRSQVVDASPYRQLLQNCANLNPRFLSAARAGSDDSADFAVVEYQVTYSVAGKPVELPVRFLVEYFGAKSGTPRWTITSLTTVGR